MSNVVNVAKGKWRSILESIGNIDPKYLDGKHHPCPVDGEGDNRFRFSDRNGGGNYFCACSDGSKDGFDLLKCCRTMEFKEAAREIERFLGATDVKPDQAPAKKSPAQIDRDLANICKGIVRDRPEVLRYLRGRGINVELSADVFQTTTSYGLYHSGVNGPMTAMMSVLRTKDGQSETVHLTYLQDGKKATITRPRILATPKRGVAGCAVRLAPVTDGVLGVGEGIESSASAFELTGIPTWATISANGMSSFELPTDVEVKELRIFIDRDKNFVGQAAGYNLARRIAQKHKDIHVIVYAPSAYNDIAELRDDGEGPAIDFNDVAKHGGR